MLGCRYSLSLSTLKVSTPSEDDRLMKYFSTFASVSEVNTDTKKMSIPVH